MVIAVMLLVFWLWRRPESSATPSAAQPTAVILAPTLIGPALATPSPTLARLGNTTPFPSSTATQPDQEALQMLMLDLINRDRAEHSLEVVAWDALAAEVGRRHAEDMVAFNYFSHWNREGLGPDHRYTLAGGQHAVMENLHAFALTYSDGRGAPVDDWEAVIEKAETSLMASPGHRANILDPAHTHVGIGMAYDEASGQFRLTQEFTNQYVTLSIALPLEAAPGEQLRVRGVIDSSVVTDVLLNLAYEAFPRPLTLEDLARTSTYTSAAEPLEGWLLDSAFDQRILLATGAGGGIYHVRIFADVDGEQALLLDHGVWVQPP